MRAPAVKSIFVVIVAAAAVAVGAATPDTATAKTSSTPCWKALINDWFDGKIDHVYPQWCYSQALGHLPKDVEYYSDAKDAITRAMLAAKRESKPVDWDPNDPTFGGGTGSSGTGGGGGDEGGGNGVVTRAIAWLGPSNADAVPLPLLILAAVALLLLAAAGASVLSKRLQARRIPPPNG
jgi:hypothetical protein